MIWIIVETKMYFEEARNVLFKENFWILWGNFSFQEKWGFYVSNKFFFKDSSGKIFLKEKKMKFEAKNFLNKLIWKFSSLNDLWFE